MVASLKFESAAGTATAVLDQVKIIILEDGTGNKYTLDTTANNLKVAYTPNGGNAKEYTVDGLAAALGKLLTIDGSTAGKSVLAEEVAKKPVVEALIPELAKDDGTTGIYTKKGVDNELAKKADTSAIPAAPDLSNYLETSKLAEEVVKKPVVEAIFDAQDLTDPVNPINFAETKIGATFAKKTDLDNKADANGTNLDDAKVTAILEKLTDKVVKTSELSAKAADKAVVEAIFDAKDLTDPANPINFAETKIGATFAKKTDLDNKADANGTNLDDAKVTAILEKLTDKVVKTSELSAKAADKAVVEAIFDAQDLTDLANPINVAETKIGATFAKIDGSNVEEAGIIAMLGKLTPANQVAKIDGSNVEEAGVNTMLGKLTDKVVKTSELSAKAADKAVVEAIFDAKDLTDPANPINFAETKIGATFAKKTDLDNKADKSYVNTELANKADTSALADKADKSELAKKADTTALDNKADKSYVNTELAKKANTADVYTKAEAENTFLKTTELKTKAAEKAVVEAIFDAKDGQKSILVEKLGLLLDSTETPYGAQSNQVAKTFLADKGLKPTPEDVATKLIENPSFQASAKIAVNAQDSEFQEAVKAVMSQPSFEIPTDSNSPLSWGW